MIKQESVLDVLMYLFKNHIQVGMNLEDLGAKKLTPKLQQAGFDRRSIKDAFSWLAKLARYNQPHILSNPNSIRLMTKEECEIFPADCRRLLQFLVEEQILNAYTREIVIDQTLELAMDEVVNTGLVKWVTLMVLYNQPEDQNALKRMEFLVLDGPTDSVH